MEKLIASFTTVFIFCLFLALSLCAMPIIGYAIGFLFGFVFEDTWLLMSSYIGLPSDITSGMFGAFVMCFGSMMGRSGSVKKEVK